MAFFSLPNFTDVFILAVDLSNLSIPTCLSLLAEKKTLPFPLRGSTLWLLSLCLKRCIGALQAPYERKSLDEHRIAMEWQSV